MKIGLIFAQGTNGAFGYKNKLPWDSIKEDMQHFSQVTKGQAVLMGRNTWESLPEKYRPLPGRLNIVLSSQSAADNNYERHGTQVQMPNPSYVNTFEQALLYAKLDRRQELWIIGGANLIQSLQSHASMAIVTEIDTAASFDVHAPELDKGWVLQSTQPASEQGIAQCLRTYRFKKYVRA